MAQKSKTSARFVTLDSEFQVDWSFKFIECLYRNASLNVGHLAIFTVLKVRILKSNYN